MLKVSGIFAVSQYNCMGVSVQHWGVGSIYISIILSIKEELKKLFLEQLMYC